MTSQSLPAACFTSDEELQRIHLSMSDGLWLLYCLLQKQTSIQLDFNFLLRQQLKLYNIICHIVAQRICVAHDIGK